MNGPDHLEGIWAVLSFNGRNGGQPAPAWLDRPMSEAVAFMNATGKHIEAENEAARRAAEEAKNRR